MSSQQQHDDDAADLALAATGDRAALGRLYDRHAGVMLGLARRFLAEPQDAMDLVHDVFVEAWQRANSYRPGQSAVRSWLLLRVRSRCLDRLRRSKVAATGLARMGDEIHDDTFASPCAEVEHGKLRGALQALDEPKRRVITLAYFSGLTCTEIAGRLDMPVGTVKTHLSRGIARMRKTLTEQPS